MEDNNLLKIYKYGDDVLRLKAKEIQNLDGKVVGFINRMAMKGVQVIATSETDPQKAVAMLVRGEALPAAEPHHH